MWCGFIVSVVFGVGILKKYCCFCLVNKLIGISRDLLFKVNGKLFYLLRRCLLEELKKLMIDVIVVFLERGDNFCVMLGKDDFVNCNGEKVQKYYFNDYIYNFYVKFRVENFNIRVGKIVFVQRRLKYIILILFSLCCICLCQYY